MNTSTSKGRDPRAVDIWFDPKMLHLRLADGRELSVPLAWFPKLKNATHGQRKRWRLIGGGVGIHWEDLDEDLSVNGLLELADT